MKRFVLNITLMLVAMVALSSCQQKSQHDEQEGDVRNLEYEVWILCTPDLLDVADMEVTLKGENGVEAIDTIRKGDERVREKEYFDSTLAPSFLSCRYIVDMGTTSIPTSASATIRYLPKSLSKEAQGKSYNLVVKLNLSDKQDHLYNKINSVIALQMNYVLGSKVATLFDIVNEEPVVLSHTAERITYPIPDFDTIPDNNIGKVLEPETLVVQE